MICRVKTARADARRAKPHAVAPTEAEPLDQFAVPRRHTPRGTADPLFVPRGLSAAGSIVCCAIPPYTRPKRSGGGAGEFGSLHSGVGQRPAD